MKRRLKAYLAEKDEGKKKFRPERDPYRHVYTKENKLEVKNANRSRKKAARQEGKRIIKDNL